jgi:membrane-associated phospholipid phosphatase
METRERATDGDGHWMALEGGAGGVAALVRRVHAATMTSHGGSPVDDLDRAPSAWRPEQLMGGQGPRRGSAVLDAVDGWLGPRWGRRRGHIVDRLMIASSRAADYWVVWLVVAAGLHLAGGGRGRRVARRGVIALVVGSSMANGPIKLAVNRPRPARLRRADLRALRSSSFPSGHTAAATAFATAVTRGWPAVGPLVVSLAGLVAYSRVYLGAHYPSDVLVGGAIGVASGLIASTNVTPARSAR